jgi:hypothetical protein
VAARGPRRESQLQQEEESTTAELERLEGHADPNRGRYRNPDGRIVSNAPLAVRDVIAERYEERAEMERADTHLPRRLFAAGTTTKKPTALLEAPPFYARYVNRVWQPFIDRDWPYFRHLRIQRLEGALVRCRVRLQRRHRDRRQLADGLGVSRRLLLDLAAVRRRQVAQLVRREGVELVALRVGQHAVAGQETER